ncbi:MAG TPA: hypothetical protein VL989_02260 [Candidatus Sulfotelmatobacter sp.]|nr:hypothetical protein [Candidatus Sulfotelmatobacter sp.]
MKKKLLSALASGAVLALLIPATSFAAPSQTSISGVVTEGGNPVSKASVVVTCGTKTKTTKSNSTGTYLVNIQQNFCPTGASINVTATKGGESGSVSGTATEETNKLNVALLNVSLVPEFGLITAASAAMIGGGAFLVVRRRHASGHEA